jgi:hypothetical protein
MKSSGLRFDRRPLIRFLRHTGCANDVSNVLSGTAVCLIFGAIEPKSGAPLRMRRRDSAKRGRRQRSVGKAAILITPIIAALARQTIEDLWWNTATN